MTQSHKTTYCTLWYSCTAHIVDF